MQIWKFGHLQYFFRPTWPTSTKQHKASLGEFYSLNEESLYLSVIIIDHRMIVTEIVVNFEIDFFWTKETGNMMVVLSQVAYTNKNKNTLHIVHPSRISSKLIIFVFVFCPSTPRFENNAAWLYHSCIKFQCTCFPPPSPEITVYTLTAHAALQA